jgi:hypothetical protein
MKFNPTTTEESSQMASTTEQVEDVRTREQVEQDLSQARENQKLHRGSDRARFTRLVRSLERELSSMTPEPEPEAPQVRVKADVVADLIATVQGRKAAETAQARKALGKQVDALLDELLTAPEKAPTKSGKQVVNIDAVMATLRASDDAMTCEDLAKAVGFEDPSAAVKARIAHYLNRAQEDGVVETPKSGKQAARYAIA